MYNEELERAWNGLQNAREQQGTVDIRDVKISTLDNEVFELGVKLTNTTRALAVITIGWVITTLILCFHLLA